MRAQWKQVLLLLLAGAAFDRLLVSLPPSGLPDAGELPARRALAHPGRADTIAAPDPTLVIYSFAATDSMSLGNLKFFLNQAVRAGDGLSYVIVINLEEHEEMSSLGLPELPPNAVYLRHRNECYDWGTYAWALDNLPSNLQLSAFTYFILMNSSIRGPFIHPMLAGRFFHWSQLFTNVISADVKLVGPSVSCEKFCIRPPNREKECRQMPHIQSVALATDKVGLKVLRDAGHVLRCHKDRNSAVYDGEIGSSMAITQAGYNIASFLVRYDGVDFRRPEFGTCNGGASPLGVHSLDGLTPGALELVFPKVKESMVESGLATHVEAVKMSKWIMQPKTHESVTMNGASAGQQRAADVVVALAKGIDCFDFDYYLTKNPDLTHWIKDRAAVFRHFLARGMMEYREHKWKCGLDESKIPTWP